MFTAKELSNIRVGDKDGYKCAIRFIAKGPSLASVRLYWIVQNPDGKPGYMGGNGGFFEYSLRTQPDAAPVAFGTEVDRVVTQNGRGAFPLIAFPPHRLTSGLPYFIVIDNVSFNPEVNFSSLDFLHNDAVLDQTPEVQVWLSAKGVPWQLAAKGAFIGSPVALIYADGTMQGSSYIAAGAQYPKGLESGVSYGFPEELL